MNHHTLLDVIPLAIAGKVMGEKRKLFARSLESPGYREHVDAVSVDLPEIDGGFKRDLWPETLAGDVDAGLFVARWLGPDHPTIVYHHGTRERPFSGSERTNSFRRLFLEDAPSIEANLIAVRAPFHTIGIRAYLDRLTEAANFAAMLAVSVAITERLIEQFGESSHVTVAGLSLGGFVSNLHRALFDSADAYVPILAGTFYSDVVLEGGFRHVTAERARNQPRTVAERFDFVEEFQESSATVRPLLARYDAHVRFDPQREAYGDVPVRGIEKGHTTGAMATETLREHVLSGLREPVAADIE